MGETLDKLSSVVLSMSVVLMALYSIDSIHIIEEGNIGIYSRGGALLQKVAEPGLNIKMPFITKKHQI